MYDLIIIGGGPAGLTAAVYAIRKRLNILLISRDLGGKTNFRLALPWIEDYQVIRGLELVNKFRQELEYLDFARQMDTVEKVEKAEGRFIVKTKSGAALEALAVILATGVRQARLEVPGEKDYMMKGLCYSALSYAPLFIDKTAIVIGAEELALRSAGELATVAKEVVLVCEGDKPLDTPLGKKLADAKNVTVLKKARVVEVKGDDYARALVVTDASGATREYKADGMFVEKGLTANASMLNNVAATDPTGRIIVDGACRTSVPGLFAAGDVTDSYAEQVLIAVGEGAKAALSAYEYLLPLI
ncbi:MAG: FAD-dependent oxidoreductase [Chloroflexota bacterium]